jgi:fermentation-respiration switch protein FrsA (DUF1100 family)
VTAASVGYIMSRDGSPVWQVARLLGVATVAAVAVRRLSTGRQVVRGVVLFATGLLSTAVGVGIGLPHLAKAGTHPLTITGLLSLVAGGFLLLAGAGTLVRRARPWMRAALIPGLLIVFAAAIFSLGQAVAATNVPRTAVGSATPADHGLPYQNVKLSTTDGVTLSGWYIASTNGAAVALLHGAGSTRSGVLDHAIVLASHGYGVLLFDVRGHGRSGGRAMDFGWYGDLDVKAAVSFLVEQPEVDEERIAAVGMSMGGEEAIGAGAADPRIAAVVAEGATNRVHDDKAWLSDKFGWRGALQEQLEWLTYTATDLLTAAGPPISLRSAVHAMTPRPLLLIAGGDMPDEGDAGRYIASGAPHSVELWIVPDTGHTAALDTHPDEWESRVTAFLAEALAADPSESPAST